MDLLYEFKNYLNDEGIIFPDLESENQFLRTVIEELQIRVGYAVSLGCTEEALKEFAGLTNPDLIKIWMMEHVPDREKIVEEQIRRMKVEIKENKHLIPSSAS